MPGIQIDFDQDIYDEIPAPLPGKKRGWIRDLVTAEVIRLRNGSSAPVQKEQEFVFRVKGKILRGPGLTPADAGSKLGLPKDPLIEWRTVADAEREGWLPRVDPLDV